MLFKYSSVNKLINDKLICTTWTLHQGVIQLTIEESIYAQYPETKNYACHVKFEDIYNENELLLHYCVPSIKEKIKNNYSNLTLDILKQLDFYASVGGFSMNEVLPPPLIKKIIAPFYAKEIVIQLEHLTNFETHDLKISKALELIFYQYNIKAWENIDINRKKRLETFSAVALDELKQEIEHKTCNILMDLGLKKSQNSYGSYLVPIDILPFDTSFNEKNLANSSEDHFFWLHRYLGEEDYKILMDLVQINQLSNERSFYLRKYIEDLQTLEMVLNPLKDLGLVFKLYLVGGCIRDLILGKPELIKDLDVVISFNEYEIENILYQYDFCKKFNSKLNIDSQINLATVGTAFYDTVYLACEKHLKIDKSFVPREELVDAEELVKNGGYSFAERRIRGVIKLNDERMNYPMDLILSNYDIDQFINKFDFGLCKTFCEIIDFNDINPLIFSSNIYCSTEFLEDYKTKTLNFNTNSRSNLSEVKATMEDHYPRLQAKYPDYKFKIDVDERAEMQAWWEHYQLNQVLESKPKNIKKVKI